MMIITELLAQNEMLLKDVAKTFAEKPAALMARAPALNEARATRLETRLKALEDERVQEIARIDADIAATKAELKTLKSRAADDAQRFAPLRETVGSSPTKVAAMATVAAKRKTPSR
jgi:hypothetical protein